MSALFLFGPRDASRHRNRRREAFTLIELLIVLGIIAVLAAILVPSLSKARDQARIVKCQANLRSAGQGVQAFANDHGGFGQIWELATPPLWPQLDSARRKYEYDYSRSGVQPTPWPVAYGGNGGTRGESLGGNRREIGLRIAIRA